MLAILFALCSALPPVREAPGQQPGDLPVSVERIREGLGKPAPAIVARPIEAPVATFRTRVEQRVYVPTLREWIDSEFTRTALQRQSDEWGSRCCGVNLLQLGRQLYQGVKRARQEREVRKLRQEIARELARLEEASRKGQRR